jgi:ABC-type transport system involved in multi-copper enzyme maturation permease subunit
MSAPAIDLQRPSVPLGRLVAVEARKVFDTRASRWFTLSILGLVLLVVVLQAFVFADGLQDLEMFLVFTGNVLGYFLPIVLIMLVTSEWGQRTALVTFTLEPRRGRVVAAKLIAGLLLSLAAFALAFLLSLLGAFLASSVRGVDVSWSIAGSDIRNFLIGNTIAVLVGFALAMLLMNTPAAIVGYFVYTFIVPVVANVLGSFVDWFGDIVPWIEFNTAQTPLFSGDGRLNGEEWAQLVTSGTIWLVIPLVLGVLRLLRSEVK